MPRPSRYKRRQFLAEAVGGGLALSALPTAEVQAEPATAAAPPAGSLEELDAAVKSVLAAKRLGEPVFVRCTAPGSTSEKESLALLGRLVQLATQWLAQPLENCFAVGALASGQVSVALRFRRGASGLVSLARSSGPANGLDLVVLGNRGAIYHEAASGGASIGIEPAQVNPKLLAVLKRALRSGQAEVVGGDEQP